MALLVGPANLTLRLELLEYKTGLGIEGTEVSSINHVKQIISSLAQGTGSNKVDSVYVSRQTISGATSLDLRGSLASALDASTVTFPLVVTILVVNNSTTTGQYVTFGEATNPVTSFFAASGDGIKIGPGGFIWLHSPTDGYATVAGTGDILTLTPSSGSVDVDIFIIGRAS